ncbi:hypothetical protein Q5752_002253 [Cryptotrichosporon argae]
MASIASLVGPYALTGDRALFHHDASNARPYSHLFPTASPTPTPSPTSYTLLAELDTPPPPAATMYASSSAGSPGSPPVHELRQLCAEFEAYPFSDDADFRAGLPTVIAAVRGSARTPTQIDEMIGRAQWFYFTRLKGVNVPWEAYMSRPSTSAPPQPDVAALDSLGEARRMMAAPDAGAGDDGAGGMSFAMLCRLISEGRAGEVAAAHVPEGLNTAQPSPATMPARAKPWETQPHQFPPPDAAYMGASAAPAGFYYPTYDMHAPTADAAQAYAYPQAQAYAQTPSPFASGASQTLQHALVDPHLADRPLYAREVGSYMSDPLVEEEEKEE